VPAPYHVRLAISRHGDQFRVELFTENLGDTSGSFFPAAVWDEKDPNTETFRDVPFTGWLTWLAENAPLLGTQGEALGKKLFKHLLGAEALLMKWVEVVKHAEQQGRELRLLIDAAEDVPALPYGLLYDAPGGHYLLRAGPVRVQLVRVLRQCTPRRLNLIRAPLRVLLAAAEPTAAGIPPVGCAACLRRLAEALARWPKYHASLCLANGERLPVREALAGPEDRWPAFCAATPEGLRQALRDGEFDVLHLIAHGYGEGVVLCASGSGRANVPAHELAEWCRPGLGKRLEMAFLQVCHASDTKGRGSFGGVAQALLNSRVGDVAAVIASPYPVEPAGSTEAAIAFYEGLAAPAGDGEEPALNPDTLLPRRLPMGNWAWAFLEMWARPGALGKPGDPGAFTFPRPYRGLARFEEQDADIFFGRKYDVEDLRHCLENEPVVTVLGDSGSGKSSMLHAGLIADVRAHGLAGLSGWRIVSLQPTQEPARSLPKALTVDENDPAPPPEFGDGYANVLQELLTRQISQRPLLLVLDQFEQIFTLCKDPAQREAVAGALAAVINQLAKEPEPRQRRFRLVLGMRNEYLTAANSGGVQRLLKRLWLLPAPSHNDLKAIISRPAEKLGYEFQGPLADGVPAHQASLLERILQDPLLPPPQPTVGSPAGSRPALPLVEFALERLWLEAVNRGEPVFTHADYDNMGGLGGAIAEHAERVYETFLAGLGADDKVQPMAERLLTGVVSANGTQRPRPRDELEEEAAAGADRALARQVLEYFVGARLLTIRSASENPAEARVELAHEVLIERWNRLAGWLALDRPGRAAKEAFENDAARWDRGMLPRTQRQSPRLLPSPEIAEKHLDWLERTVGLVLTPTQTAFRDALYAQREELRIAARRSVKRLRLGIVAALVVAVGLACLTAYAVWAGTQASRALADTQRQLTLNYIERGVGLCEGNNAPEGMLYLLRGYEIAGDDASVRSSACNLMGGWGRSLGIRLRHEGRVRAVAFSRTARPCSPAVMTRRRGCGTQPPASPTASPSATRRTWPPWPSAQTARPCSPAAGTRRRGCGTRPPASPAANPSATTRTWSPWPSARTARPRSPAVGT
jgi:hypothetical protein